MLLFRIPKVAILEDNVYPKQKPLYAIVPYTIGIPITVEPTNQRIIANKKLEIIASFNIFVLSICTLSFKLFTNPLIYELISFACSLPELLTKIMPKTNPIKKIIVIIAISLKLFLI